MNTKWLRIVQDHVIPIDSIEIEEKRVIVDTGNVNKRPKRRVKK